MAKAHHNDFRGRYAVVDQIGIGDRSKSPNAGPDRLVARVDAFLVAS